ncbi:MAG TPA: hypothetical protein VI456_06855 [Polyangia bacterium]
MSAAALLALLAATVVAPEGADGPAAPTALVVEAQGSCPSGEAVRAALLPALTEAPAAAGRQTPRVSDLGDRFQVDAAGQTGAFVDVARDCTERARVAAVFIALALSPPAAPERPAPPPPPAETPRPRQWFELAVEARLDGASVGAPAATTLAWGGEVRAAVGRGMIGVAATAGLLAPTDDAFGSVEVRQQRFPLSLSLTLGHDLQRGFRVAADLGLAVVPLTLKGEGLSAVAPATRLDLGARLAVALRLPALGGRLAPVVGLHADLFPRPYRFSVDPLGDIGSSSGFWLGASLGLSYLGR